MEYRDRRPISEKYTSLEHRTLILLRALYGREDFSDEEFRAARNQILEEIATEVLRPATRNNQPNGLRLDTTSFRREQIAQNQPHLFLPGGFSEKLSTAASKRMPAELAHISAEPLTSLDAPSASPAIRMAGLAVRTLFMLVLVVITARVASPQLERLSSVYETPGDLIRVLMGLGICSWLIVNLFRLPKDLRAYRTWVLIGIALLPLLLLCAIVIW
jgi:hypothetical protein